MKKFGNSCPEEKRVLKNFAKFTGKHLHWNLFLLELELSGVFT